MISEKDFYVRTMKRDDLPRLRDIYMAVFTAPPWNFSWLSKENVDRYFSDMFSSPPFAGFVCVCKNAAIGGCFGDISDYFAHSQYYIKEVFVDSRIQRNGVGSLFLRLAERRLKTIGVVSVTLFTSKTIPAYDFYLKNGYETEERNVYMAKFIGEE
ncbi:MAG: GNAT family N-acetyltransferase [Clostridiales bacterium]|jgi:aminoglycoside 6'-N-acetyltransferase I|nr:GNAT family N-acetyltransferase [Clostridiales bacterium]